MKNLMDNQLIVVASKPKIDCLSSLSPLRSNITHIGETSFFHRRKYQSMHGAGRWDFPENYVTDRVAT